MGKKKKRAKKTLSSYEKQRKAAKARDRRRERLELLIQSNLRAVSKKYYCFFEKRY